MECKGQITIVRGPEPIVTYVIKPSRNVVKITKNGIANPRTISCDVYRQENGGADEKLYSSSVCLTYTLNSDNTEHYMPLAEDGVNYGSIDIDTKWEYITFKLYLQSTNFQQRPGLYIDPSKLWGTFVVPVIHDGQVDVNFQIWQGEDDEPTLENAPYTDWVADAHDDPANHIGDYYISPLMKYYEFKYDEEGGLYYWDGITDQTLINILNRTNEGSTQGLYIKERTVSIEKPFGKDTYVNRETGEEVVFGDDDEDVIYSLFGAPIDKKLFKYNTDTEQFDYVQSNAFDRFFNGEYDGTTRTYKTGDLVQYDGNLYIAWKDMTNNTSSFNDFKLGSSLEEKFNRAGISIQDKLSINITADTIRFFNTEEEDPVMLFNTAVDNEGNSYARINSDLLKIDGNVEITENALIRGNVSANQFTAQHDSNSPKIQMTQDGLIFYNKNGEPRGKIFLKDDSMCIGLLGDDGDWKYSNLDSDAWQSKDDSVMYTWINLGNEFYYAEGDIDTIKSNIQEDIYNWADCGFNEKPLYQYQSEKESDVNKSLDGLIYTATYNNIKPSTPKFTGLVAQNKNMNPAVIVGSTSVVYKLVFDKYENGKLTQRNYEIVKSVKKGNLLY